MLKKIMAVIFSLFITASLLASCAGNHADKATGLDNGSTADRHGKIKVVTTVFPLYDWVREVAQDDVDLSIDLLLDNGVDLHSYQPTAKDIMDISDCDLFVYVGGESDKWVEDVLKQANNKKMIVLDLMEILGDKAKKEELKEGMQGEEEEHEDEPEYDEHVWLSLKNAVTFTEKIAEALGKVDTQHAGSFSENAAAYMEKLSALDKAYQQAVDDAKVKTLLFGDRFPFRYLTDDYGLDYYAAFVGCSAETEASFETVTFLSGKVDELGLKSIMQIETSDGSIAQTIRDNTKTKDQQILTLNSLQNSTAEDIKSGTTYLGVMTENLEVLKKAL